jgi:hypothetical protein
MADDDGERKKKEARFVEWPGDGRGGKWPKAGGDPVVVRGGGLFGACVEREILLAGVATCGVEGSLGVLVMVCGCGSGSKGRRVDGWREKWEAGGKGVSCRFLGSWSHCHFRFWGPEAAHKENSVGFGLGW